MQTGQVVGYVQKFKELQYRLPRMTDEEAFHTFISGLQPHLQEHVGAHVQGDLEAPIAMAQRLEVYRGGERAKTASKGPKKFKTQKKGNVAQVKGSSSEGVRAIADYILQPKTAAATSELLAVSLSQDKLSQNTASCP